MQKIKKLLIACLVTLTGSLSASAQYAQIANQISNLVQPALSGSMKYRGIVEATGLAGVGTNRANFLGVSTSQGFQYADWFFMGVGMGIDVAMAGGPEMNYPNPDGSKHPPYDGHGYTRTKAMIPLFTDFRFSFGPSQGTKAYLGLKAGAAWLLGNDYFELSNGRMAGTTQFYLSPSVGVKFPMGNSGQAVVAALSYQLLTANNSWTYYGANSTTLNSLGVTIAYEW